MDLIGKQAKDILECRIEAVLEEMSLTPLCDIPEEDAITVEEFQKMTEDCCNDASVSVAK